MSLSTHSHYPTYDVWEEHQEWDSHTRKIVGLRRMPQVTYKFLKHQEAMLLQIAAGLLMDETRLEVLTFITQHIDESLASPIGESQRKSGVPEKKTLYRKGLQGIDEICQLLYQTDFMMLKKHQQESVLKRVEKGTAEMTPAWALVSQQDFFVRLLYDVTSACYSHPLVWSDIGYGGPAYPRGYIRVEKGLVDPWEAKRDGE